MIWPEKISRDGKGHSDVLEVVGVFVAFSVALLGQQHLPGSLNRGTREVCRAYGPYLM